MYYFGVFMIIFSICLFLTGLYAYTGHKIGILTYRAAFRNLKISEWKNIGRWVIVVSIFIFVFGIILMIIN